MRLFWALELPDAIRERLVAAADALRQAAPRARVGWVQPDAMHLTLKFLGDGIEDAAPIAAAGRAALGGGPGALDLAVTRVGSFGSRRDPRVVWAAVEGPGLPGLQELVARLEGAMAKLGFARERRPYAPHITLGRVRPPRSRDERDGLAELARALESPPAPGPLPWRPDRVVLFESQLRGPKPPVYAAREQVELAAAAA